MTDPANGPAGPYNEDADRQSNTAPDEETAEAPAGLPWELNPAVEKPAGNYDTLAEAEEAQGLTKPSTSSTDDAPATAAPAAGGEPSQAQSGTVSSPASQPTTAPGDTAVGTQPTDAPINEAGDAAPAATDQTVTGDKPTEYEGE